MCHEVYIDAETWDKMAVSSICLPEPVSDANKETYAKLKKAILDRLDPDTDEHHLAARDQLFQRRLHEGVESIDEMARDLDKPHQDLHLTCVKLSQEGG